jgi:transposase InsO family protein
MSAGPLQFLLMTFAGWVNRQQFAAIEYLKEENRVLRQQMGPRRPRLSDEQRRRRAVKGRILGRRALGEVAGIVTPETILRWYRELIAAKYDGTTRRTAGRPATAASIQSLVVRFASENPSWGYTRIRDVLGNLGHVIARNTVKRILDEHGLEPAPTRRNRMSWKTFVRAHCGAIAATDFFSVEVLTLGGLARYFVLFVIDIESRRVQVAGVVRHAHGAWMKQIARQLTDCVDGFLRGKRYLIHDRDPLFTEEFRELLRGAGVECLKLPAHSPNLNAYAERFVLSIKTECLGKIVPLGERHLRLVLSEYVEHYHTERNHQGLDGRLPAKEPLVGEKGDDRDPVVCRQRLGGLLNYYHRGEERLAA